MKRFIVFVILIAVLIAGGGLTAQLIASRGEGLLPVLTVTRIPEASTLMVVPWQAEQLFLLIGFLLFNLIGIGVTLAVIFWLLDRGVRRAQAEAGESQPGGKEITPAE